MKKIAYIASCVCVSSAVLLSETTPSKSPFSIAKGDGVFSTHIEFRPELFYGKNLSFLESNNADQIIYNRHVLDITGEYALNREKKEAVHAKITVRDQAYWGDPGLAVPVRYATVKIADVVTGLHAHRIPRLEVYIRELWFKIAGEQLSDSYVGTKKRELTCGAFPFLLGRGVSLGASYRVSPDLFESDLLNYIDQYAFGALYNHEFIAQKFAAQAYVGILTNRSDTFENVNAKINGQEIGRRDTQARGFGAVNYVIAGKLLWTPRTGDRKNITGELYCAFGDDRETSLGVFGDLSSKLITPGCSFEWEQGKYEAGFDIAFNRGHQTIKGWDNNYLILENRVGYLMNVNNSVRQYLPPESVSQAQQALVTTDNQLIINTSPQGHDYNGAIIGEDSLGTLINDNDRYRNSYHNNYRGVMCAADAGYYVTPRCRLAAGLGYASGGPNLTNEILDRNLPHPNGSYKGFVGIQESYTGNRVQSAFFLNGAALVSRPLLLYSPYGSSPLSYSSSGFSNLIFVGSSFLLKNREKERTYSFFPNILAYWQDTPVQHITKAADTTLVVETFTAKYLGLELNEFLEIECVKDLKFFAIAGLFFPGTIFKEIDHIVIDDDGRTYGDDTSYFINIGFDYTY